MEELQPQSAVELADALASAASARRSVHLFGNGSKNLMGGAIHPADLSISVARLNRVLAYEPRDLTVSVEAGMKFADLTRLLGENRQMVPLDPHFSHEATVGGVIASNASGPRRRMFGTARDLVIGMSFATLEGKIVDTGGMVVKNVAGLDMGKLMIGSFGTLAAITKVNFKLIPLPPATRTFLMTYDSVSAAMLARDSILRSVLQPVAIDYVNAHAAVHLNRNKHLLLVQAAGSPVVLERYATELGSTEYVEAEAEVGLWSKIVNFTPYYLAKHADGAVVRVSCTLKEMQKAVELLDVPVISRAGSGVCYGYFWDCERAAKWVAQAAKKELRAVIEFAAAQKRAGLELWPKPDGGFETMLRIKRMFDPDNLLNRGRMYGRI